MSEEQSQETKETKVFDYDHPEYKSILSESIKRKEKIRELEEQFSNIETEKLKAEGKKDELIETLQSQISELKPKAELAESAIEERKAILEATRLDVLNEFPESYRDTYKDVQDINVLRQIKKDFLNKKLGTPAGQPGTVEGYTSPAEAAMAYKQGEIDAKTYNKIRKTFTSRVG